MVLKARRKLTTAIKKAASLENFSFAPEDAVTPLARALLGKWDIDYSITPAAPSFSDTQLVKFLRLLTSARIAVADEIEERLEHENAIQLPTPGDANFYRMIRDCLAKDGVIDCLGNLIRSDMSMDITIVSHVDIANLKDVFENYAISRDRHCRAHPHTPSSGRTILNNAMDEYITKVKRLQNSESCVSTFRCTMMLMQCCQVAPASSLRFAPLEETEEEDKSEEESQDDLTLNEPILHPLVAHPVATNNITDQDDEGEDQEADESLFVSSDDDADSGDTPGDESGNGESSAERELIRAKRALKRARNKEMQKEQEARALRQRIAQLTDEAERVEEECRQDGAEVVRCRRRRYKRLRRALNTQ